MRDTHTHSIYFNEQHWPAKVKHSDNTTCLAWRSTFKLPSKMSNIQDKYESKAKLSPTNFIILSILMSPSASAVEFYEREESLLFYVLKL